MPARTLSDSPTTVDPFDVMGRSDGSGNLMVHALLCDEPNRRNDVTRQSQIQCAHMGPPLERRTGSCDAVGTAELDDGHRRKIKVFVDDRLKERAAEQERLQRLRLRDRFLIEYQIHPPASRPSRGFPLWRFSCVGFVLRAYQEARITLLGDPLPLRTVEDLKRFYPSSAQYLDDPQMRTRLGIGEGDRWPVALVGYVLNSLSRDASQIREIPFVPRPGDEYFPPVPPPVS